MKILVVDDHPMFREGLASVLRQWPAVSSVLQASDGELALGLVAAQPDVAAVIVDLRMAGTGGLVVVAQLRRLRPDLPVLVLSSSEEPDDVRRALAAGAAGYCPKSAAPATLLAALQLVLAGQVYVPPLMAQAPAAPAATGDGSGLTPRQREVLQQLCLGQTNKQIARILAMQEKTVKGHVSAIFKALNVVHRLQAVEAARNAGLVS
jgi:two-component system nitrate/nitrite response regulator NarL